LGQPIFIQGESKMMMPSKISTWCMILFFLGTGLAHFFSALTGGIFSILWGIFALGAAVFLFLDK
jgi:hypothetical protein